jgi:hypothetical protein
MLRPLNRALSANLIIGASIALFAYFLKESALLELALAVCAKVSAWLCLTLAHNRLQYSLSPLGLVSDALCVLLSALIWTYAGTTRRKLLGTACLIVLLVPLSVVVYHSQHLILISPLIVTGILAAISAETLSDLLSKQIHTRLLDEKKEGEFSILGHLSHNVKPNIQIARSPIVAVHRFLEQRGITAEIIGRRMDGSSETVGEALDKSILSLSQITGILDNTKKLVTQQILAEDFTEVSLVALLAAEVAPLYADRLAIRVLGNEQLTVRLHKDSFVEAVNNLVRNAEIHGFGGLNGPADAAQAAGAAACRPELCFVVSETRKRVLIDYTNNGKPFPANLTAKDFIAFGRKSNDSPGDGLGGAWIGKVVEAHHGSFEILRDEHPVHFRITLPKGGI